MKFILFLNNYPLNSRFSTFTPRCSTMRFPVSLYAFDKAFFVVFLAIIPNKL